MLKTERERENTGGGREAARRKEEVRQLEIRGERSGTAGKSCSPERKEKLTETRRLTGLVSDRTEH